MTVVRVGDLMVSDESGFACGKSKLVDHGLPHLRPFNITDDGRLELGQVYQVPVNEAPKSKRQLLPGDVLFNNTNSAELVGKTAIIREPMTAGFSNHLTRIRVDAKRVEPAYFAQWLRRLRTTGFFTAQATQWVSQAAFRTSELRALEIDLPSMGEQRRVVDLLARAEGIVCLRREAQQKAAELIPAIFIDMFGDPATNPKGWPLRQFGNVGNLDRGKSRHRPRDASVLYGGPYPFIQTGDVANSGGRVRSYTATYSQVGLAQSRLWSAGTLCITIAANIAKTGVLEFDACFPDSVVGFVPGDIVRVGFVQAWLGFLQPTLEANAPQAAQRNINLEILRALPIPVPPIELQAAFVDRCERVIGIGRLQSDASARASQTFEALLHRVFAG
jgi:type I restriction enzyme, S subunit